MGLFSDSDDEKALKAVFGQSTKLDHIVWRGTPQGLGVKPGDFVDIIVSSDKPALVECQRVIALFWLPPADCDGGGCIAKGTQTYKDGQTVNLPNVPIKNGTLALAADQCLLSTLVARVKAVPRGAGDVIETAATPKGDSDPLTQGAKALGSSLGDAVGFAVVAFLAYQIFLREVAK